MSELIEHELIVRDVYKLPLLPQSAARLIHLTASDKTDLGEIIQVIEFDPVLTMKLLRVANSAGIGASQRVGSVRDAVVRLGLRTVSSLALGVSVRPQLMQTVRGYNISGSLFWKHSLAAALATEFTQMFTNKPTPTFAFTAAMLHDVGKVVLGQLLQPDVLQLLAEARAEGRLDPVTAEIEVLSLHHGEVGGIVAQHWGLPEPIVTAIIHHHDPDCGGDKISQLVALANEVAHVLTDPPENEAGIPVPPRTPAEAVLRANDLSPEVFAMLVKAVEARLATVLSAYEK